MTRLQLLSLANGIQRHYGVKTRVGMNCLYFTPNRMLGFGDKCKDKIEYVEDLTNEIVDCIRYSGLVNDCFCRITGEEVKIIFI